MNSVSGSSDLKRLMGEYESFNVIHWWYKGLLRGLGGPKIGQNCQRYVTSGDIFTFPHHKSEIRIQFLIVLTYGHFWNNISSRIYVPHC